MTSIKLRSRVINEIKNIPDEKLSELYDFIRHFRVRIKNAKTKSNDIMKFAGIWQDMPDKEFKLFLKEQKNNRSRAFKGRKKSETLAR